MATHTADNNRDREVLRAQRHPAPLGGYRQYYTAVHATVFLTFVAALVRVFASPELSSAWPPQEHITMGESSLNGYMAISGVIVTLWAISVRYRTSGSVIRGHLSTAAELLVLLPLLPLLRYPVTDLRHVGNLYWYAYYIPFVHVPTLLVFCAFRAAALDVRPEAVRLLRIDGVLSILLVALALTNDLHHLVFRWESPTITTDAYAYGPLYWIVLGFVALNAIVFFAVLFRAAGNHKQRTLTPIGVLLLSGAAYMLVYALGTAQLPLDNLPMQFLAICMIVIEYCLDTRLFPSYMGYSTLFRALPFEVMVLSNHLVPVFSTDQAKDKGLSAEVVLHLADEIPLGRGETAALPSQPGSMTTAYGITGGVAVLTESTAEMDRRRQDLQNAHDELEHGNAMLRRQREMRAALFRQRREHELLTDVNESLLWATTAIHLLLDELPSELDEGRAEERRRSLILVRLLLAYCKRKGALVLAEKAGNQLDAERLQLVLGETMTDLGLADIEGAALVEVTQALPASTFSVIYDCLYDFVTIAFVNEDSTLMVFLHEYGSNSVELRIAMECDSLDVSCADELRDVLDKRDVSYRITEEEDALKLSVIVARTEEVSP